MKDHLSTSTESHLNALCDLVYSQKKQLESQRERIQLQKEHIQLQKETLLLQKQEIIAVRSRTANGEFIWRITDFTRKLMDAKSGRAPEPMISEPFYTHPHGYKMCAGLWLNGVGTGRGRYISVGLQVSSTENPFGKVEAFPPSVYPRLDKFLSRITSASNTYKSSFYTRTIPQWNSLSAEVIVHPKC